VPSIVGTWKLVRAVARDGSGATLPEPYGGKGIGRVTFTADGRMQSMVCDGRKEMPPLSRVRAPAREMLLEMKGRGRPTRSSVGGSIG
jgi:hypothetical protein